MKINLSLLCLLAAFSAWAKPIVIKGKINGKLPDALHYTAPVNGSLGFDFYYTAPVDAKGNFEIKADSDEITFIDLYYNYLSAGNILAAPGGQYNITITEANGAVTHEITGTDAELQKQYNILVPGMRVALLHNLGNEGMKIEPETALKAFFDSKLQADLSALQAAAPKNAPKDYLLPVIHEREYFYANAMSLALYSKNFRTVYDETVPKVSDAFNAMWKEIYTKNPPDKAFIQRLPLGYWFLTSYDFYKDHEATGFDAKKAYETAKALTSEEKRRRVLANIPVQNAEYYSALSLYNQVYEGQLEKSAVDGYVDFKKSYPRSSYIKYLEPNMAPVIAFFTESGALPKGAAYVDGYARVNSFDELVQKFPGKKIYIDVWATWCGPCRQEFKYKDELYKLLKANDITVVYISIDEDNRDEGWKKMIGHYGLQGYHIRANKTFEKDLRALFQDNGSISIPWYILVNSNGTIAARHAPSPSTLPSLETEIKKLQ